jgi:hypothetical protein
MSAGPGRAERAILDALEGARSPLGAPLWLTVDEIAEAACYRLPLEAAERDSLRRAARRLSVKGDVLTAKAGDRWASSRRVAPSVLRPDLRRGTLLARTLSVRRQGSDQGVSKKNTELSEGKSKELPRDLQGPPLDLPQGIPFSEAGDKPEDVESVALILNGTSRSRVEELWTEPHFVVTEGSVRGAPLPPRAFTGTELQAMRRDDSDEEWELLDDPGVTEAVDRPTEVLDEVSSWERDLYLAGELDFSDERVYIEPDDVWPERSEVPLEEPEPVTCTRCGAPAVREGACATHLCENCHEHPWHAKRLCRACVEWARTHNGEPRPARLWQKNRKGGPTWP